MEIISEAIRRIGGVNCANRISNAFSEIEHVVAANDTEEVEKLFNLCDPIDVNNSLDIMNLMTELSDTSSEMVHYKGFVFRIKVKCRLKVDKKFLSVLTISNGLAL